MPLLTGALVLYPLDMAQAAVVSCPVTDGGAGDGDATVNGIIQISASTTWTMPSGAAGDYWDCTGKAILVTNSAVLTLAGHLASGAYPFIQTDNVQIDLGASISGDSKGCTSAQSGTYYGFAPNSSNICTQGATGAGAYSTNSGGGGGHGGAGGASSTGAAGGTSYDSLSAPILFGASGAATSSSLGGAGGGMIKLEVSGTITHNGALTVNGGNGTSGGGRSGGGGSGGTLTITAGTFAGTTGTFSAAGGAGGNDTNDGGGGGAGRVAVVCTTCSFSFDTTDFTLTGGTAGSLPLEGGKGSAYVRNTTADAATIYGNFVVQDTSYSFTEALTFDPASTQTCLSTVIAPSVSADTLTLGGTFTCTAATLTSLTLSATAGAVNMVSGTVLNANVVGATLNINQAAASTGTWTDATITGGTKGSFVIDDAVSVNLAGTTSITGNVNWTNLVDLVVASGASINANGKGCTSAQSGSNYGFAPNSSNICTQGATGAGVYNSNASGGGGHGGAGGASSTGAAGGTSYDSLSTPILFGASGAATLGAVGGSGGGMIKLEVSGTITHNGALTVNGGNGTLGGGRSGGGGSGGTIQITAGTFAGTTGTFSATGGNGGDDSNDGGGGGGGRVAVKYVTDSSSFLAGLTAVGVAPGGVGPGAAADGSTGTLYTAVTSTVPNQPSITAPTDAATGVSRTPTLTTSAYSGAQTHLSTDWQVATDSSFTDVIWSSITDTDDLESIAVNTTKGTFSGTLSGKTKLNSDTYYVRARHTNLTGNSTYSATTSFTTLNTAPTVASLTPVQKTNDSSIVDVSFVVDDVDDDDQVMVKVELDIGAGYIDPTLSAVNGDTTSTYGDPTVDNAATYQIGTSAAWITTSSGANTVNFDLAASNFTGMNGTATLRLTPNDQGVDGTPVTQTFTVDDVNPTLPGSFANTVATINSATFTWTASTETNFHHYEVWYGTNTTDVANRTGTAVEWDNDPNDAALTTRTTATTIVTGLSSGATYYAKLCAVDNYGNEVCTSPNISFALTSAPTTPTGISASQATNGSGDVTISFTADDLDDQDLSAKIEYSLNGGSSWNDPTISTTNAETISTPTGDPTVDNTATYQLGSIVTSSGASTVTTIWEAATDILGSTNIANAQVRITPYDGTNLGTAGSSANFILDRVAPTEPAPFSVNSSSSSSITFGWTASTETNFNHYELWYGTVQADVQNRTGTATEWDNDPNDANLAVRTTTTTVITGLTQATTYYAIICAVDNFGNETCKATAISKATGTPPAISSLSAAEKTDGTKVVDVQFTIDDVDDDNTLQVKVELNTGSGWVDPTIDTTNSNTTATYGDPGVNNSETYQIGTAGAYVTSSSGANVVHFDLVAANFTDIDSDLVQVRLTPTDGGGAGSVATSSSFSVDAVNPVAPSNFVKSTSTGTAATLTWTAGSDARFNHYELWYGTTQSDVQGKTGTAAEWDNDPNDGNLTSAATATTVVNGLTAGATYYILICAVDNFGNNTCTSDINFIANALPVVSSINITTPTNGSGEVTVAFNLTDTDANNMNVLVEYNLNNGTGWLKATLSTNPVKTTVSAGASPTVNNAAAYQLSGVGGNGGSANAVSFVWLSSTDSPGADLSNVQIRLTPADAYEVGSVQTPAAITVDNSAPTGLANFQMSTHNSSSITWTWSKATEAHFSRYSIWYGTTLDDVNNRTGTATRWDEGNDATLTNINTVSTTITGLSENTTYYAKIWATDTYGNEMTLSAATANNNGRPTLSGLSAVQSSNADGLVSVSISSADLDLLNDVELLFEYNMGLGQGWEKATLAASPLTMAYGTATLNNAAARQVTSVDSDTGSNTTQVVWRSALDKPTANTATAQFRVVPYDAIESGALLSISNVTVDNTAPVGLANLAMTFNTPTSAVLTWTAVSSEVSFDHYEIWYGTSLAEVQARNGSAVEWDNTDSGLLATMSTATTTIGTLNPGVTYYVKIWAVDHGGNEATILHTSGIGNTAPTVSSVLPVVSTSGNGVVTVTAVTNDADGNNVQFLLEYNLQNGSGWKVATVGSTVTVSAGVTPTVNNADPQNRRLQGIRTNSGANTVTLQWLSKTDEPTADISTVLFRTTPYDGVSTGTAVASSAFVLDNKAPVGLAAFTVGLEVNTLNITWSAVYEETNWDHYEIWYGQDSAAVTNETATKIDNLTTADLAQMSTSGSLIPVTNGGVFYLKIVAVDDYGNRSTSSVSSQTITYDAIMVGGSAVHQSSGSLNQDEDTKEDTKEDSTEDTTEETSSTSEENTSIGSGVGSVENLAGHSIQSFEHWSASYMGGFAEQESVQAAVESQPTFTEIVDSIFSTPDEKISREESVEMLLVLIDESEFSETDLDSFTDLDSNDPRSIYIDYAADNDLVDGYPDGKFHGENPLNRAEALKLILKFYGLEVNEARDNPFKDVGDGEWYAPYVLFAYNKKIVEGYSDSTYKPEQYVSYAEFLKMATVAKALADGQ